MSKSSGVTLRVEQWKSLEVPTNKASWVLKNKVVFRYPNGQFHGATNFPVRKVKKTGSPISRLARG